MEMKKILLTIGCLQIACMGVWGASERYENDEHWNVYGNYLSMRRTELNGTTLAQTSTKRVMNSRDLLHRFKTESGYRVGAVYSPTRRHGFEGCFSTLAPWGGRSEKVSPTDELSFPFKESDYSHDFTDASYAQGFYQSKYWDAQLNFWRYFTEKRPQYFGLDGLLGLRFFHWDERFSLNMGTVQSASSYKITSENRIIALQGGIDFQMHPTRLLCWEIMAKGGVFANSAEQSQTLKDFNNLFTLRSHSAQKWRTGLYADVLMQLGLELFKWLEVHGGYQALFFQGLALAPEQVSHGVKPSSGGKVNTRGKASIQGWVGGATLRF